LETKIGNAPLKFSATYARRGVLRKSPGVTARGAKVVCGGFVLLLATLPTGKLLRNEGGVSD